MRILWRALPDLALPLALGLALAYLGTGFVPRPAPALRPPDELRARGLGYAEESPVRAILERNVLALETTVFDPQGVPPRAEQAPVPAEPAAAPQPASQAAPSPIPAPQRAAQTGNQPGSQPGNQTAQPAQPQAAFAPLDPSVKAPAAKVPGAMTASAPLSGGPAVQGPVAVPSTAPASEQAPAHPQIPTQALPEAKGQRPVAASPSNQPAQQPAQAPPPAAAPAPPLTGIRLVGVIAGGSKPQAMLSVDGQALSLEPGGSVRGWTLQSVEPGRIVLKSGPHTRALTLGGQQPN